MNPKRIRYLGHYDTDENADQGRNYALSAVSKMDYVADVLQRLGYAVEIVSASTTKLSHSQPGSVTHRRNGVTVRLFKSLPNGGTLQRVCRAVAAKTILSVYMAVAMRKSDTVLVYHSIAYGWGLLLARWVRGFKVILEVEEIYSDLTGVGRFASALERRLLRAADAYIFSTPLLDQRVNSTGKPFVVAYGNYIVTPRRNTPSYDGRIHAVYSGIVDQVKGGAFLAARCALHLDANYHIHILGFGKANDLSSLESEVMNLSAETECLVTVEPPLEGADYQVFLQSCHIGLSTHNTIGAYNASSFPSKVLTYLGNGLQVVSAQVEVLEESPFREHMVFYDGDAPSEVAAAIRRASVTLNHGAMGLLAELDSLFMVDLRALLDDV